MIKKLLRSRKNESAYLEITPLYEFFINFMKISRTSFSGVLTAVLLLPVNFCCHKPDQLNDKQSSWSFSRRRAWSKEQKFSMDYIKFTT